MAGPLFIWHFTYVTAGSDGANYLQAVINGDPVHNYGAYLLKPLMATGLSPLQSLSLLYYVIMAVAIFMTWKLLRKYSLETAIIGTPLLILGNYGVWRLWFDGSALSLGGLLIFNFGALICLSNYCGNGKYLIRYQLYHREWKWLIPFALFMIGGILFHKTTGLYLIGTSLIFALVKKDLRIGLISGLIGLSGLFLWRGDNDLINSTLQNLTWLDFANLSLFLAICVVGFWKYKEKFHRLNPLTQMLAILLLVIFTGTLIHNPYQFRMQLDSLTIIMVFVSILIARGIVFIPERYKNYAFGIAIFIPLMLSSSNWLSDYQAIHTEDLQTLENVNTLANINPLTIATTYGENPAILRLYFNDNVRVTTDINTADIILVRHQKIAINEEHGARTANKVEIAFKTLQPLNNQIYGIRGR